MHYLIVNADDFGLARGVCEAVLRCHEEGILTSTSALTVGPAFDAYAPALASTGLGVGLHLCCVGEDPPLLDAREVPSLVDGNGRFPMSWKQVMANSARGRIDAEDLRREFSAQLERLRSFGIEPTHIDSHQNLHLWPQIATIMFDLAEHEGIGAIRVTRSSRFGVVPAGVNTLARVLERRARARGIRYPERSTGLDEAGGLHESAMVDAIIKLGRPGSGWAELATHPGFDPDPDRQRYAWGYQWAAEASALTGTAVRAAVQRTGARLAHFGDLCRAPS